MKNTEHIKKEKINSIDRLIQEQYKLRLEIIGQKITNIYYNYDSVKNQIRIPDIEVLNLPKGCLWMKMDNGNIYQISTDYISLNELDRGVIIIKAKKEKAITSEKFVRDRSRLSSWRPIINQKITVAEWNWKGGYGYRNFKKNKIDRNTILDQIEHNSYYPENITLHFENKQKLIIVAADPDEEIPGTKRYNLLTAGSELMVFFSKDKLNQWGLTNPGFEINMEDS